MSQKFEKIFKVPYDVQDDDVKVYTIKNLSHGTLCSYGLELVCHEMCTVLPYGLASSQCYAYIFSQRHTDAQEAENWNI